MSILNYFATLKGGSKELALEKFLVVDDERLLTCLYEDRLKEMYPDAVVTKALNGEEAMAKVRETDYSLILSDLIMPVMDGINFYKTLKSEYPEMSKKIGFISGSSDEKLFSFLADEGRPVITKPFKNEVFKHFVEENIQLLKNEKSPIDYECSRKHSRLRYIDSCILKPVAAAVGSFAVPGITEDYSTGGIRLNHKSSTLNKGDLVKVFVNVLGIVNREARVVWSSAVDSGSKTGLQWA